ncbi:hypothetical protein F5Y15DRAFT_392974 [Xylariaceae sp. FL0016]|nr:hypothetical protein F5Y15DRAFT_392974 [Xylariaceae sp. FL0016]
MSVLKVGHFQSLDLSAPGSVVIHDRIYGSHTISEPALVDLLRSRALARLIGVRQHGISGFFGITPSITRFEHSVGAFLLVRLVGGSLEEQVAGLLHDISHTTMSHVVDFAFLDPGEGSFHEVHKIRLIKTTEIPGILTKHGFGDLKPLDEELFPLVEQTAPHLCADRLDYGLRDSLGFGNLKVEDAHAVVSSLKAHPNSNSPTRMLVLQDPSVALTLARAYMKSDRNVWGNPAHGQLYTRTANLMRDAIRDGGIEEDELWRLSDDEFWAKMRTVLDAEGQKEMASLEAEGLPNEKGLSLPLGAKIRTIDPDICTPSSQEAVPLSVLIPAYAAEKEEYVRARKALFTKD